MKHELDRRVARELKMNRATVSRVTSEFLRQISLMLAKYGWVLLNEFGTFSVHSHKGRTANLHQGQFKGGRRPGTRKVVVPSYLQVHFSKSRKLKRLLDEHYKE